MDVGSYLLSSDSKTFAKAERVLKKKLVQFQKKEDDIYEFVCQSETDKNVFYEVDLICEDDEMVMTYCTCPTHNMDDDCKHAIACMLFFQQNEYMISPVLTQGKPVVTLASSPINYQLYYSSTLNTWSIFNSVSIINQKKIKLLPVQITGEGHKSVTCKVVEKNGESWVTVTKSASHIICTCSCGITFKLCQHSCAALLHILLVKNNANYLDTLRDITEEKKELLTPYGISEEDAEASLFEFYFEGSELKIKPLKENIITLAKWESANTLLKKIDAEKSVDRLKPIIIPKDYILLLRKQIQAPWFRFDVYPIESEENKIKSLLTKLNTFNISELKTYCPDYAPFLDRLSPRGILETMNGRSLPSHYNAEYELRNLAAYKKNEISAAIAEIFKEFIDKLAIDKKIYTTQKSNKPKVADLVQLEFSSHFFTPHLLVSLKGKFVEVKMQIKIENQIYEMAEFENISNLLFIQNNLAYLIDNNKFINFIEDFSRQPEKLFLQSEVNNLVKNYLLPLRNLISMDLPEGMVPEISVPTDISFAIRLKEMEPNYLLLQPVIIYDTIQAELDNEEIQINRDGKTINIKRLKEKEDELNQLIRGLHPNFESQKSHRYFYITFPQALHGGWFFEILKKLTEANIEVFGQKQLTKFRYNVNKPKLNISGKSGTDWFDITIELNYGQEIVSLKALRQAILNKQDFIQLGDGSLGILPEEWIKKFRPMFQLGNENKENSLQVSNLHYTLIDELHNEINDDELIQALLFKKQELKNIENIKNVALPKNLKAKLRPYQQSGFQWFNHLHQLGWGGCLADDMGLGKTLQAICFLQKLYNENKGLKCIIVCPTSLIYNWEAELKKFGSGIPYHIYHGVERELPGGKKTKWNILITSYGTLRNDIEIINSMEFDVTILDESQSIKNPISQVTKAVQLIKTKHRFILSGTPVQNNTFDLYAQLNFCNPGLLGNQEFFKREYAIPIDKYGDKEKSEQLRKIVFPFVLRRTKEQVAKDLPDKTETILYCEMGAYQQQVYDATKEEYRDKIMNKIASDGMGKSAFMILEGLNKLRLICDCPSLIANEEKNRFRQESIKLNELMREIEENISNHKMLIFSQFLGMLDLIRQKLDADGIKYIYLDGSTPAKERGRLVEEFQTNKSIQIFLISLKAGGVGLNLTAADYVYMIDPWWNPAVEDQAIDRTHRIGQNKKVFAYKLICKNSIEEKIIQLQEKKKSLAKELITEDASFVKKLTKDDVAWLLN